VLEEGPQGIIFIDLRGLMGRVWMIESGQGRAGQGRAEYGSEGECAVWESFNMSRLQLSVLQ
jgi:hypothetical protein